MAARGETDPLAVKEGETLNNLLSYGPGVDLARTFGEAMPIVGTTKFEGQSYLTLSHRRRLGDPSIRCDVELSHDLVAWADAAGDLVELAKPAPLGGGTELVHSGASQFGGLLRIARESDGSAAVSTRVALRVCVVASPICAAFRSRSPGLGTGCF